MRDPIFSEQHNIYQVRTALSTLIYGVLISLGIGSLGYIADDYVYMIVGAFVAAGTVVLFINFLIPRQLILGTSRMLLPLALPTRKKTLLYRNIEGHFLHRFKGTRYLGIKMKDGKTYDIQADSISDWGRFYSDLKSKVPVYQLKPPPGASRRNLLLVGVVAGLILAVAARADFIEPRLALLSGGVIILIILLAMFAKSTR